METTKRICRKCLTRDMNQGEFFRNMYLYIENLSDEIKAAEECYEERLSICKACARLSDGMCNACGCFVEMRAAAAKNCCPYHKW